MVLIDEGLDIQSSATVGTSVVELSGEKNNLKRVELIIANTSTAGQVISLGIGVNAVAGVGITLQAGASYVAAVDAKYKVTNKRVTAIGNAANGSVAIYERAE